MPGVDMAVWRIFAVNAFREAWSFNQTLREFRRLGWGIRRADALAAFRAVNNLQKGWKAAEGISRTVLYPLNKMVEAANLRGWKYRVHGTATYRDLETGEEWSKEVSYFTDKRNSLEGWEADYVRDYPEIDTEPENAVIGATFAVVEHQEGFSY